MSQAQLSQTDPFVQGVNISIKKIRLKKILHKTIFILLTIQGIRGLFHTVTDIFLVYPKLSLYYQALNFDQAIYDQIIRKAILISITSFIEVTFGLSMAIKKSGQVKTIHTILGLLILLASLYLKREGNLPDFEAIDQLVHLFRTTNIHSLFS